MANFQQAFNRTILFEGGYSNDPNDFGKETIFGISRVYHPGWEGWNRVNALKALSYTAKQIEEDDIVGSGIEQFYRDQYWNPILGNSISDQSIANELFDCAVNMGIGRAITFLQKGLNVLNRNQKDYPNISEDGHIGPKTLSTLDIYLKKNDGYLLKVMMILRGACYIDIMEKNETQEKFAKGWLNRVTIE